MASKIPGNQSDVGKLYQSVIEDVINNVREAFLDDGVDEQVLQELKSSWENKLMQSKALETQVPQGNIQRSGMPIYMNQPLLYRTMADGQSIQMSAAGQQATLALPNSVPVVYQQKLPTSASAPSQIYAAYQPAHQVSQQPNTQPVLVTTQHQEQKSSGTQGQPSVIIQVDGSTDSQQSSCSKADYVVHKTQNIDKEKSMDLTHQCCPPCENDDMLIKLIKTSKQKKKPMFLQVDGPADSSSDEYDSDDLDEDDDDDEDEDDDDEDVEGKGSPAAAVDQPLCSDDDGTDEDPVELFDTDNVVVCQYDKIQRTKSRWKFTLKVGIMNLNGKDRVFQKAMGEAEW